MKNTCQHCFKDFDSVEAVGNHIRDAHGFPYFKMSPVFTYLGSNMPPHLQRDDLPEELLMTDTSSTIPVLAPIVDSELIDRLTKRYTADEVPPCRICGREMSIQSAGGGNATVWGCTEWEPDPDKPGQNRRAEGRYIADDHYERSRWTQYRDGDPDVLELIRIVKEMMK